MTHILHKLGLLAVGFHCLGGSNTKTLVGMVQVDVDALELLGYPVVVDKVQHKEAGNYQYGTKSHKEAQAVGLCLLQTGLAQETLCGKRVGQLARKQALVVVGKALRLGGCIGYELRVAGEMKLELGIC